MMKRMRALVYGRVQGVGYRAAVLRRSAGISVTGFVRNLPDGRVEIVAEGDKKALDDLLDVARSGSDWCSVDGIETQYLEAEGTFTSFDIAH